MNVKKNDQIIIIKGKDKGKIGKVEKTFPKTSSCIVTGLNKFKKHLKPSKKNPHGGIVDIHQPINRANLAIICPHCTKITKVKNKITKDKKIRICHKCQQTLD